MECSFPVANQGRSETLTHGPIPTLTPVATFESISRTSKRLLDGGSWLRCNVEFGELGAHLEDVDTGSIEDLLRRRDGDCKVGVLGQSRDEEHEAARLYLHFSKIGAAGGDVGVLGHALFVCFENAGDALKAIRKRIGILCFPSDVGDCQTCCPLVQYKLSSIDDFRQLREEGLDGTRVRDQEVDNLCPRLVQALVPDACREKLDCVAEAFACVADVGGALVVHCFTKTGLDKVHLVDETKDLCAGAALVESTDDIRVGYDIGLELAGFDIEDEDEDGHGTEDVTAGLGKVVFDKAVLAASC